MFGILVVEIEVDDGMVGFVVMIGGEFVCYIVEKYFVCFFEGVSLIDYEKIWD